MNLLIILSILSLYKQHKNLVLYFILSRFGLLKLFWVNKFVMFDWFHFAWNKILGIFLLLVAIGFAFTGVGIIATIILGYAAYGLLTQSKDDL